MRYFSKVLISCFLLSGCFITSCSDDAIKDDNYPDLEENMIDLTDGLNVKIVDLDKENLIRIPLGTKKDIVWELISEWEESRKINFKIETGDDNLKYLVTETLEDLVAEKEAPKIIELRVALKNGNQEKIVKLVVRSSSTDQLPAFAKNHMGFSMLPTDPYQSTRIKILSEEAIVPITECGTVSLNSEKKFDAFDMGGIRFPDLMVRFGKFVGIPDELLTKGLFTGGHYFNSPTQHDSVANYEDYLGCFRAPRENVYINPDILAADRENGELYKYLDSDVNDIFNNNKTWGYRKYHNDEEGVYKLLDDYGVYVITGGTFGSTFSYYFSRKENVYKHHIGCDARINIFKTEDDNIGTGGMDARTWANDYCDFMEELLNRTTCVDGLSSFSFYYSVSHRPIKYYSKVRRSGILPSVNDKYFINKAEEFTDTVYNLRDWKLLNENPTEDLKAGYTLVAYSPIGLEENEESDFQSGTSLIPIYEFIYEPTRRKAVEKYFKSYLLSKVPEFKKHNLVIKEFYMKYTDAYDNGDSSHRLSPEQEGFCDSYFGGITFRRALMANANARYDGGYPLETNQDDYILATSDKRHYWYYTLGYHEDGDGITDLRLKNSDPGGEWIGLGDNADNGTGWADNKDNLVYVKRASKDEPLENKIKAVALSFDKKMNEYYSDKIIGSTSPVAMEYPFSTSTEILHESDYYKYWATNYPAMYDGTHFYEGVIVDYPFHVIYNKQPLPDLGENGLCFGMRDDGKMEEIPPVAYPKTFRLQY